MRERFRNWMRTPSLRGQLIWLSVSSVLVTLLISLLILVLLISNVMGYGNQKGYTQMYRGTKYNVNLLPKVKVETVIPKELADPIIDAVVDEINTGNYGDGKIFVYDVQDAIRIRTGEHGRGAL